MPVAKQPYRSYVLTGVQTRAHGALPLLLKERELRMFSSVKEHRVFKTVQVICYFKATAWGYPAGVHYRASEGKGVVAGPCLSSPHCILEVINLCMCNSHMPHAPSWDPGVWSPIYFEAYRPLKRETHY